MGRHGPDPGGPLVHQDVGRRADGPGRVDHVVDEHAHAAPDFAHDIEGLDLVDRVLGAPLVDAGHVEIAGEGTGRLVSGATMTKSLPACSRRYSVSSGTAVRWSTGPSKNPWIWPECRSTDMIRSAPARAKKSETIRALIGSRPLDLRSWRE